MPGTRAVAAQTAAATISQFTSTRNSSRMSLLFSPDESSSSGTGMGQAGSRSPSRVLTLVSRVPSETSNSAPTAVHVTRTPAAASSQPMSAMVMPNSPNCSVYLVTRGAM